MLTFAKKIFFAFTLALYLQPHMALANFTKLDNFGADPGELLASYYAANSPSKDLVVLLHGCVQNGEALATDSGFLALAKKHDFTLLIPQQIENNNIKSCFNWFSEQDTDKDSGESLSLKNMILALKAKVKAKNVYIAGLSAGGAMASAMLVNYPDMFSAGAIIAGIPFPCADNLIKAISCMRNGPSQTVDELTAIVKQTTVEAQLWPKLSVWTGNQDTVVHPQNAIVLAKHWAKLTESHENSDIQQHQGYQISQWKNTENNTMVELIEIENMGHGIAVNPQVVDGGKTAPFLLDSSISAAKNIIEFWGVK